MMPSCAAQVGVWAGGLVGKFDRHERGGKSLGAVEVEIDGGAFGVRLDDNTETILHVPHKLAFR